MKINHTCTQVTARSVRCDLSFFPLSSASSPCSACWPAQQLGWIGLARRGGVSLGSPYIVPGEGRRGCAIPTLLMCQWCPALHLLHLHSIFPCLLQVTRWKRSSKQLQTLEGRSLQSLQRRENTQRNLPYTQTFLLIYFVLCGNTSCRKQGLNSLPLGCRRSLHYLRSVFWEQTAWMEYQMLGAKLVKHIKNVPMTEWIGLILKLHLLSFFKDL